MAFDINGGQAALVEGDADDHADAVGVAGVEQAVLGGLVEHVVDDLHGVDRSGLDGGDGVVRLVVVDADAEGTHLAVAVTTADGSGDGVGIDWSVSGNTDSRTKISNYGDLYIGPNETGASGKLTITATAVGVNPADGTNYSAISGTTQVTAVVTVAPADGGADAGDPGNDDPAAG